MTALFLMTVLACTDSKEEVDLNEEPTETLESRTSGSIEIKAFVPEKTKDESTDDVLPKPDLDIDGNPVVATTTNSKVVVTTTEGDLLTFVKKETDPTTGVETITVTIADE